MNAADDIAQAVLKQWTRFGLDTQVPGGLQRERLSSFQPGDSTQQPAVPPVQQSVFERTVPRKRPYASFSVVKGRDALHQTSGGYADCRLVTIEIRGLESEVSAALTSIRDQKVFNRQTPQTNAPLQTSSPFMACIQWDSDEIREDAARKQGENVWIGTLRFECWTERAE